MKTIFGLLTTLIALCASGQTYTALFDLKDASISSTPYTNRTLKIYPMSMPTVYSPSVILRAPMTGITDGNGQFTQTNLVQGLYKTLVLAPPFQEIFSFLITSNNTSTFSVSTNLTADATATFPAGSVAWAAAVSDLRYAAKGAVGTDAVGKLNSGSTNQILLNPSTTNLVNRGNAISSLGPTGSGSEQFGQNAQATANTSTAVGFGAAATAANATAIGGSSLASASGATAVGELSTANTVNATAIGANATTSRANQVMLGGSGTVEVSIAGLVSIYQGTGSPEGSVTASTGSLYLNRTGGSGTTLYVKESGSGNTGWIGK